MAERRVLVNALAAKAGGFRNFIVNLIRKIENDPRDGLSLTFLLPQGAADDLGRCSHVAVVPFERLPGRPMLRAAWEQTMLPLYARRARADLLVSASSFGPRFPGTRHLVWLRNDLYFSPEYATLIRDDPEGSRQLARSRRLLRASLAGAHRVAVLQEGMVPRVRALHAIPEDRFVVIPNACPAPAGEVRDEIRRLRERYPDRYIVNGIQYFHRYRNFGVLTSAVRTLQARGCDDVLLLLSVDAEEEPPHSARFLSTLQARDLRDHVLNFGRVSLAEVYDLYGRSDVAAFPSLSEAFSVAYLMAMERGAPVVASDFPFARALCGDAALYFPHNDPDALADHILDLRANADLRASLVKRGEGAASRYTWDRTLKAFYDAIDETLEAPLRTVRP